MLQAIFEYQTAICELTGMDVSNASGYDGTTVAADACYMAKHVTGRARIVVTEATNPQVRQVMKTYAPGFGLEVVEVPHAGGVTDPAAVAAAAEDAAAVVFQQPNFFGCLEPAPDLAAAAAEAGALPVAHVDPLSLGVLEAPGRYGCAIVAGEGQGAGNAQSFGGPHYGFLACRSEHIRRMPGRIVGQTTDAEGRRGYVLTLSTREQHIRREKATSNITTNQTLLALGGLVYLTWLGPRGLREVGETCMSLAGYARRRLEEAGLELVFPNETTFKEFAVRVGRNATRGRSSCPRARRPSRLRARARLRGHGRLRARRRNREAIAGGDRPPRRGARGGRRVKLIYEKSRPGRTAYSFPRHELPAPDVPAELRRSEPPRLPETAEFELVRHFTELTTRNFGVDTGFYPLGSCTMKHNPRVNEVVVRYPGFADLHPLQDEDGAQGALELMWRLQEILAEVCGLDAVSLQPAAGSQGELTGLMLMHAYFADRGEDDTRRRIVVPDTAHGTNPASVTMAGYELVQVATDARGNIDLEDLRGKVDETTAGLMLTNPSTLGLFDEGIEEVQRIFHGAGALMYYDGANLNAVCGIARPGDMGFDIVHINLHKTFSQPHGGGGPGGGPIAVRDILEPFLPVPQVVRRGDGFGYDFDRPKTIGKVRGFSGPFGVFVRSYAFIRSYGPALRRDVRGGRAQRELPARAAARLVRPAVRPPLHARVRALRAHAEARARHHRARRREAAHGLRVPSADDLLPARRAGGAHDRADGDRGEGDARRVRRGHARDRRARRATIPSCCVRRRTRSPSAVSTR